VIALLWWACNAGPGGSDPLDTSDASDTSAPQPSYTCVLPEASYPDFGETLGCPDDFAQLASAPLDASIPGARSVKTLVDRLDDGHLWFANSARYPIHFDFASTFLSGNGLPFVGDLSAFNAREYYAPDRRFLLGALTHYEEPDAWVYEIAPYDTADASMITEAYRAIAAHSFLGDRLLFHPTSEAVAAVAAGLPADVQQVSTEELFAGITYQPLNLGTAVGQLRFYRAEQVEDYVNYREIVVLDRIPNDLSVVAASITGQFQTPLAHINVLAQNRGTPNMGLIGAFDDPTLRAFEGRWVALDVGPLAWSIREVTEAEADAWWAANAPEPLDVAPMDTSVVGVHDCGEIVDPSVSLAEGIAAAVPAFGGKVTHMAAMTPLRASIALAPCMGIPVSAYDEHMRRNGLWDRYEALRTDPNWGDARYRAALLRGFQREIQLAPIDPELLASVVSRIASSFAGAQMRFRSSTNAEDLGDFTGAGLYTSYAADWSADGAEIADALRGVWSSAWNPRAYEERTYWGIDHRSVGMGVLSNPSYDGEQANGVAVTGNVYDTSGLEPAFYINVQAGEASVVLPEQGTTTDQILYYYNLPGQPIVYIGRSNLVLPGTTVLDAAALYDLGTSLDAIHRFFQPVYGTSGGFYAMDTEFKWVDGRIEIKQARPYPGWSNP
jgi:hypothetical protein